MGKRVYLKINDEFFKKKTLNIHFLVFEKQFLQFLMIFNIKVIVGHWIILHLHQVLLFILFILSWILFYFVETIKTGTFGELPSDIPPFLLGIVTFDNWLMHRAIKLKNVMVVGAVN